MTTHGSGASMLRCVLVADDGTESVLTVPSLSAEPPARIRVPGSLGGAAVADVFALSHVRDQPPEAVYMYVATVPRSTDELPEEGRDGIGPLLPE
ncbi:hypothetical protein [Leifsonia sp. LS-T14]|uniref:hypothetical protein n=1 Tax=unclassified Leifsonia TaxID=2663824 RepID=UPI0035A5A72D